VPDDAALAAIRVVEPVPQPTSRTRSAGLTAAAAKSASSYWASERSNRSALAAQ